MKITDTIKIKIFMGLFFLWGILTGRVLPQWEDIARSPYWFAEILMYWLMILLAIVVLWNEHKTRKESED